MPPTKQMKPTMTRADHIEHLKNRYAECLQHGDKKMAEMFKQKYTNMEKGIA